MSQPTGETDNRDAELPINSYKNTHPMIFGFVATGNLTVLENVIDANQQGFEVIIADATDNELSIARVAKALNASVIESINRQDAIERLRKHLRVRSDTNSDGLVIIATDDSRQINFERTIEIAMTTNGVTKAVPRAVDETVEVLVGIPAYNEATTVGDVVRKAIQHADEVLVVDDASNDDTAVVAEEAGATVCSHDQNRGYGGAINTLFAEAKMRDVEHLVVIDGDGQHDPLDIPKALQTQRETKADIVIGSRFVQDVETELPLYRHVGLAIVNSLTNLSMGVIRRRSWVKDTQSGFRTYNQAAITTLAHDDDIGDGMYASTNILFHAHEENYEIIEIGTNIDYTVENPSTQNPVSHGLKLVGNILKTIETERPVTSLVLPGLLSAVAGVGLGYWTLLNFVSTGSFPTGIAMSSTFFTLSGIFTCFTGIILHSINTQLN